MAPHLGDRAGAVSGEPLALHHKSRIEALLAESGLPFSECSFANLYLFRSLHAYRFVDGDAPHLLGVTYDGVRHAIPLTRSIAPFRGVNWPDADCLFPVANGGAWNDDDSDYLYDASALATLEGPALKARRQQARAYSNRWVGELKLNPLGFAEKTGFLLDLWLEQTGKPAADTDYAMCGEAIRLATQLGLECALLTSAGEPHGFLMASLLPDGSKAVHFAKARRDLPGAYPFLFSSYAAAAGVETLNFEQDLGKPGFRQAKRALGPRCQLRKYRVFRG